MADYNDTSLKQVIVNILSKEKFDSLTNKDVNQFYLTTDEEDSYTQSESDAKYATKNELTSGLNSKQNVGDYATNTVLNSGLATKVNISQGSENVDKILIIDSNGNVSLSSNIITDYALASSLTSHTSNVSNPHSVTKAQVGLGNVNNTSDLNKPISTATQTALDLKADKSTTYTKTEIDNTKANKVIPTAANNVAKLDATGDLIDGGALGKLAVKDTISTNDINDNSIISSKIKDSAVGSSKIIDGAITNAKIAENAAISISKIDGLQENLDSKLNIQQGIENYRKIVSVDSEGALTLIDNENLSVDGIGLLFEEKMFPIPIDDVRLVPLNNPGQTTGALYEGFSAKFPDAWNILVEAKAKAIAGESGYERYNKTQAEYDAELLRTTIYDTDGSTVLKMGFCGFFVIDEENDTVRFPFKGDAFDRGQVNGIDVDILDQIRNITGEVGNGLRTTSGGSTNTSGAFTWGVNNAASYANNTTSASYAHTLRFDASNVVPTGIENQPRAQGKFYYLVLANAVDAISEVKLRDSIDAYVNDTTLPYIAEEGNKWVDNVRNYLGTFISSARNNIPYGTLRCDGLSNSNELGLSYSKDNFPDLYDALVKGNLKSVSIDVFDSLVANNGWCGVFGLQLETSSKSAIFKTPKITNASQQNVIPLEDGSNKHLGRTLVKEQSPNLSDNNRYYKIYDDGWVEQGGTIPTGMSSLTYLIAMADTSYNFSISHLSANNANTSNFSQLGLNTITTTGFTCANFTSVVRSWKIEGYANSSVIEDLIHPNNNFFIQCYNTNNEVTIADYTSMLDDYSDNTLKPEINEHIDNYVDDNIKPDLNNYINQAKNWATSTTVVDSANNLYSSKYYATQTENYVDQAKAWATSTTIVDATNDLWSAREYARRAADNAQCYYQPIKYVNLTANGTTTVNLNSHPIIICQDNNSSLNGSSSYTINMAFDIATTSIDSWTYELHLDIGGAVPTINWKVDNNSTIRWLSYSPTAPQLSDAITMFTVRNQGGIIIMNYSGAY